MSTPKTTRPTAALVERIAQAERYVQGATVRSAVLQVPRSVATFV